MTPSPICGARTLVFLIGKLIINSALTFVGGGKLLNMQTGHRRDSEQRAIRTPIWMAVSDDLHRIVITYPCYNKLLKLTQNPQTC